MVILFRVVGMLFCYLMESKVYRKYLWNYSRELVLVKEWCVMFFKVLNNFYFVCLGK